MRKLSLGVVGAWTCGVLLTAQGITSNDLYTVRSMLHETYDTVKKHYYDPKFHGLDWDARFKEYNDKLKTASSLNAGLAIIAGFLDGLKDSHTYFQPPSRPYRIDYGYRFGLIGPDIYVTRVRPETDAVSKVHPGDRVVTVNGNGVDRESFERMQYLLQVLSPQQTTQLVLRDVADQERTVSVATKIIPGRRVRDLTGGDGGADLTDFIHEMDASDQLLRQQYVEVGDVMIWKMPVFEMDNAEVDRLFGIARKHATLILDLRGNPGGLIATLSRTVGNVFDRDITIAARVSRQGTATIGAKTRGASSAFGGKVIVLVDSASGSAAELFARVIQLEKRGIVLGDRSAGAVMESLQYGASVGDITMLTLYGMSVTDADLIMKDGKSLEHDGVLPDEVILPAGADLAAGRDPVMARAAQLAGLALDAIAAGKLFPFEWRPF
jgi:carboxyl-terminal processing protease